MEDELFYNQKKVCPICGKEFAPQHTNQKYCCKECRWKAGRFYSDKNRDIRFGADGRIQKKCVECGEWFTPRENRQLCCGRECSKAREARLAREKRRSKAGMPLTEKSEIEKRKVRMRGIGAMNAYAREMGMSYGQMMAARILNGT